MAEEINGVWVLSREETAQLEGRALLAKRGLTPDICLRLSGFTDGEGCFAIPDASRGNKYGKTYRCMFLIKLRADDRPVLDLFRKHTGMGRIYDVESAGAGEGSRKPQVVWSVTRKDDCLALVDLFRAYPLWSKKRRDFEVWARAVELWMLVQHGERTSWELMGDMAREIRETREYRHVEPSASDPRPDPRTHPEHWTE